MLLLVSTLVTVAGEFVANLSIFDQSQLPELQWQCCEFIYLFIYLFILFIYLFIYTRLKTSGLNILKVIIKNTNNLPINKLC